MTCIVVMLCGEWRGLIRCVVFYVVHPLLLLVVLRVHRFADIGRPMEVAKELIYVHLLLWCDVDRLSYVSYFVGEFLGVLLRCENRQAAMLGKQLR